MMATNKFVVPGSMPLTGFGLDAVVAWKPVRRVRKGLLDWNAPWRQRGIYLAREGCVVCGKGVLVDGLEEEEREEREMTRMKGGETKQVQTKEQE